MPGHWKPALSSRHRRACLALYKSLLSQSLRVQIPPNTLQSLPPLPIHTPLTNETPLALLIRNGFRRNRSLTSPRLICSALKQGYRFLTLLTRAAEDPNSTEYASVVDFLQKNASRVEEIRAQREKEREKRRRFIEVVTTRKPGTGPLLKRVTPEGVRPPVYEPGIEWPRPLSIFPSGVRKPPTLVATSAGVPFLRFGGRQSRFLERVLRQKTNWRMEKIRILLDAQDEGMEWARDEDQWEELMGLLFLKENPDAVRELGQEDQMPDEPSYASSLHGMCAVLIDEIQAETEDQVARAKALWKMVLMEREQALKEAKEQLEREGKGDEEPQIKSWRRPVWEKKTPKWMREKGFDKKNARKAALEKRKENIRKAMEKFWWFKNAGEAAAVATGSKNTASQLPTVAEDPTKTKLGEASVGKRTTETEHSDDI